MDRLQAYVNQIFASVPPSQRAAEQKQEMLLDLQDKYRDLLAEGYNMEEAYRIVVNGVGDLSELLESLKHEQPYYSGFDANAAYGGGTRQRPRETRDRPQERKQRNTTAWVIGLVLIGVFVILPLAGLLTMCSISNHFFSHEPGASIGRFVSGLTHDVLDGVESAAYYRYDDADGYLPASGEAALDGVDIIDIDWVNGDIELIVDDGDSVRFAESGGETLPEWQRLRYRQDGSRLSIRYCASGRDLGRLTEKHLTIYIPAGLRLAQLCTDVVSAAVTLRDVTVDDLTVNATSGDLTLEDCQVESMGYSSTSGVLYAAGSFTTVSCDGVSGDVYLVCAAAPQHITVDTVSGYTELLLPAGSGFRATLDSVSGTLDSDFSGVWSRDSIRVNDEAGNYSFASVSGDVEIKQN